MTAGLSFDSSKPTIIAALHLPPSPASHHPAAQSISKAIDFALANAAKAVKVGIEALYIQDLGDFPLAKHVQPDTVATLSVVGAALRREYPRLFLGVCLMGHAAKEPLAIAAAIQAQFVRIKVYVGTMVKAEGVLEGCAQEAIQYRAHLGADSVKIFADVYDRTGQPLGRMPIAEEARQAAVFGRADGLVLTGLSFDESKQMLNEVRREKFAVPLLLGGGANAGNIKELVGLADGIVVSSAFKSTSGWTREAMTAEWDLEKMQVFMDAWQKSCLS